MNSPVDRLPTLVACRKNAAGVSCEPDRAAAAAEKGENKMLFCEKLIRLRKQKGLSQEELGLELGVSRQTVSKWEAGVSQS